MPTPLPSADDFSVCRPTLVRLSTTFAPSFDDVAPSVDDVAPSVDVVALLSYLLNVSDTVGSLQQELHYGMTSSSSARQCKQAVPYVVEFVLPLEELVVPAFDS